MPCATSIHLFFIHLFCHRYAPYVCPCWLPQPGYVGSCPCLHQDMLLRLRACRACSALGAGAPVYGSYLLQHQLHYTLRQLLVYQGIQC